MATRAVVYIQNVGTRPSEPGSPTSVVIVGWYAQAITDAGEAVSIGGETVEPLNAELNGVTNMRIENDAKAALAAIGTTVTGAVHVFGGRTS